MKVCRLQKSLYDMKESPCDWFSKFIKADETFGMKKSKSDYSVFYKNSIYGIIMLVAYVDDIVIIRSDLVSHLLNPFFTINFTQRI